MTFLAAEGLVLHWSRITATSDSKVKAFVRGLHGVLVKRQTAADAHLLLFKAMNSRITPCLLLLSRSVLLRLKQWIFKAFNTIFTSVLHVSHKQPIIKTLSDLCGEPHLNPISELQTPGKHENSHDEDQNGRISCVSEKCQNKGFICLQSKDTYHHRKKLKPRPFAPVSTCSCVNINMTSSALSLTGALMSRGPPPAHPFIMTTFKTHKHQSDAGRPTILHSGFCSRALLHLR